MVRSFDRRIESLFIIQDKILKQQVINILVYNLKDNVNTYLMQEDGTYVKKEHVHEAPFDIHKEFFNVNFEQMMKGKLFE